MPISAEALTALREATRWNPTGARALLALLEEHPDWVKHKADEFGPLHLVLDAVPPRRLAGPGVDVPYRPEPFPAGFLPACRQFGEEWRQQSFSKAELAQELERIIQEQDRSDGPADRPAA
jgi:hypothetical protein